jgi:hypothetical protein
VTQPKKFDFETRRGGGYLGEESPIGAARKLMWVFLPHIAASSLDKLLGYKGSILASCLGSESGREAAISRRDASR